MGRRKGHIAAILWVEFIKVELPGLPAIHAAHIILLQAAPAGIHDIRVVCIKHQPAGVVESEHRLPVLPAVVGSEHAHREDYRVGCGRCTRFDDHLSDAAPVRSARSPDSNARGDGYSIRQAA